MSGFSCAVCHCGRNLKACSGCGNIFYCSVEHQKQNWKEHKGNCKPFRISSADKELRKFLEAKRDIKCGQVIFSEQPIVIGPDWSFDLFEELSTFNCVGCFQPIRVFNHRCPQCKWPCCQPKCVGLRNPKLHDIECSLLKGGLGVKHESDYQSIRDYYRTDVLLSLKCLILQHTNPKKFHELMDLESHHEARKTSQTFTDSQKHIDYLEENYLEPLMKIEEKTGKIIVPKKDRKTLEKIYGIIETNAIYLTSDDSIAGLYAIGGLIEHSCLPNCHFLFDKKNGFNLTVRAARDIKKGEHITTCYSNVLWGTQMRRKQLKDGKYFNCSCERCVDPSELGTHFSSLKCIGDDAVLCEGGIQVPSNPLSDDTVEWICNKCPCRVAGDQVTILMTKVGEEIEHCMKNTPNPAAIESLIDKLKIFLHPQHYHMFTLKYSLIQLYGNHKDYSIETISMDLLMRKLNLTDNLLSILKRLDPHNVRLSIYTAVVLYEKFNSIVEMQKRQLEKVPYSTDEALKCLHYAQTILMNELDTVEGRQLNDKICDAIIQQQHNHGKDSSKKLSKKGKI